MTLKAYRPDQDHNNQSQQSLVPDLRERLEAFPKPDFGAGSSKLKRMFGILFLIGTVSAIGYLTYSAFKYSTPPKNIDDVPLVRADIGPVKTIPADPGGTQFENQDKLIYKNLEDPNLKTAKSSEDEDLVKKEDVQLRTPPSVAKKPKVKKEELAKKEPEQKEVEVAAEPQKSEEKEVVVDSAKSKPKAETVKDVASKVESNAKVAKSKVSKEVVTKEDKKKVVKKDAYQQAKKEAPKSKEVISASDLEKKIDAEIESKSTAKAQATPVAKAKEEISSPFDLLDNAQ